MRKQQREAILALLEETYMGTETALNYSTPFELLVAVIMSAQCTDERVNKITARIFPKYNTPEKWAHFLRNSWKKRFVTVDCSDRRLKICWQHVKC